MIDTFNIRNHLQAMITALDNHEYGRMPLNHFEFVFNSKTAHIHDLIEAEKLGVAIEKLRLAKEE